MPHPTRRRVASALTVLPLAACAGRMPLGGGPSPAAQDRRFLLVSAQNSQFMVQSAQLALAKTTRAPVRDFAQRMAEYHAAAGQGWTRLAAARQVALSPALDAEQQQRLAVLDVASTTFDAEYVNAQVAAHEAAVASLEAEASTGQDREVADAARDALPEVRSHLAQARRLGRR